MDKYAVTRYSIALFIVTGCSYFGGQIPVSKQMPIYQSLRDMSGIILAISGIWIAIIYPQALATIFNPKASNKDEQIKRLDSLTKPMRYSATILALILLLYLISPILYLLDGLKSYYAVLRSISFGLLGLLTWIQIWALFASLLEEDKLKLIAKRKHNTEKLIDRALSVAQRLKRKPDSK